MQEVNCSVWQRRHPPHPGPSHRSLTSRVWVNLTFACSCTQRTATRVWDFLVCHKTVWEKHTMIFACPALVFVLVLQGKVLFLWLENGLNWVCYMCVSVSRAAVSFLTFKTTLFPIFCSICDMSRHERAHSLHSGFGPIHSAKLHLQLLQWIYSGFLGPRHSFLETSSHKWQRLRCISLSEKRVYRGSGKELHMPHRK